MLRSETAAMAHGLPDIRYAESAFVVLAEDEPNSYKDAMNSPNALSGDPCAKPNMTYLWDITPGNSLRNPQAATLSDAGGPSESRGTTWELLTSSRPDLSHRAFHKLRDLTTTKPFPLP